MTEEPQAEAGPVLRILTLADHAAAHDDRLDVIGAGIQWYRPALLPGPIGQLYLAVLISLPWTYANEAHQLRIRWLDTKRNAIASDPVVRADVEVGRPPQTRPGDEIDVLLAVSLTGVQARVEEHTYFHVEFDGNELGVLPLRIRSSERPTPPPTG